VNGRRRPPRRADHGAQRLVAEARWRCDNDAANGEALRQVVEQLEAVNRAVGITSLRWNVNLLGAGVGWVRAEYLDRLHAMGCSIQLAANGWVNSRDAKTIVGHAYRTIGAHPIRKSLFSNATHISPLNPWLHLYYVTTGLNPLGQQVNPASNSHAGRRYACVPREQLVHAMEDRLGTIRAWPVRRPSRCLTGTIFPSPTPISRRSSRC
jgi:hypothetical protein